MVANPTRGQLNKENVSFPHLRSCLRIGLACSFPILRLNLVRGFSLFHVRFYLFYYTVQVSLEFIRSRNCVHVMFTAESTAAQGQYLAVVKGSSSYECCLFRKSDGPINNVHLSFSTPTSATAVDMTCATHKVLGGDVCPFFRVLYRAMDKIGYARVLLGQNRA